MVTKHQMERLADYQLPEMLRTPLEELILQIKILKLGAAAAFLNKAIEPPTDIALLNAISSLRQLVGLCSVCVCPYIYICSASVHEDGSTNMSMSMPTFASQNMFVICSVYLGIIQFGTCVYTYFLYFLVSRMLLMLRRI